MSSRMQQLRRARLSLAIRIVLAAGATLGIAQLHADSAEAQFAPVLQLAALNGSDGFRVDGPAASALAGFAVAKGGDINGDGIDDYVIGAASDKVYVVFGHSGVSAASISLSTLNGTNGFRVDAAAGGESFGRSVGGGGDINGDGYDDIVIGAYKSNANDYHSGAAFVVFGHSGAFPAALNVSTLNGSNGFEIVGAAANDKVGRSVAIVRDIDGDGFDEVALGATYASSVSGAYTYNGFAYVVFGHSGAFASALSLSSIDGSNGFRIDGPVGDRLGRSVSGAGDVNGDGFNDIIAGSQYGGSAYVVFGHSGTFTSPLAAGTLNGSNGFAIKSIDQERTAGSSVAGVGDVNGDGIDDVAAGVPGVPLTPRDRVYVVFGHTGAFASSLAFDDVGGTNGFRLDGPAGWRTGIAVAGAGDISGDGFADIVIGAPYPFNSGGHAYVMFGHSGVFASPFELSTLNGSNGFRMDGTGVQVLTGWSVAGVGDINHDAGDDIIVGAYAADPPGLANAGSSYVVYGVRPDPIFANGFEGP